MYSNIYNYNTHFNDRPISATNNYEASYQNNNLIKKKKYLLNLISLV
jgi:hypothetical protein